MASFPVLLVEDKDSLRVMLRRALEAQAHLVLEAHDGRALDRVSFEVQP